jgi:hypothetical protein
LTGRAGDGNGIPVAVLTRKRGAWKTGSSATSMLHIYEPGEYFLVASGLTAYALVYRQ